MCLSSKPSQRLEDSGASSEVSRMGFLHTALGEWGHGTAVSGGVETRVGARVSPEEWQ